MMDTAFSTFPFIVAGAVVLLLIIFFYYVPFLLWISAKVSGVNISLLQLFLMRIRKVPPYIITQAMIEAHKARIGGSLLSGRTCRKGSPCAGFGFESEHRTDFPNGHRHRLGRT